MAGITATTNLGLASALTLISVLHKLYPDKFEVDKTVRLLGNEQALNAIKRGDPPAEVLRAAAARMDDFVGRRQKVLIYER